MQEKVYFENSKGNKLCGILSNPTGDKNKAIIILCHGFSSSKDSKTYVALEKVLNKNNISTLRFDFHARGESEGKFEELTISQGTDDIINVIKFLKKSGYSKIGLQGSSYGGMTAILAAAKSNDLYLLALKCPVSDYLGRIIAKLSESKIEIWKKQGFIYYPSSDGKKRRLNYSFYEDNEKIDCYKAARNIKIPTLIVHGDKDDVVPIEQSKKICSIIENCKLEIVEGAGHMFSNTGEFEKVIELIREFIIKNSH